MVAVEVVVAALPPTAAAAPLAFSAMVATARKVSVCKRCSYRGTHRARELRSHLALAAAASGQSEAALLLAWAAGMAGPATDLGVGFARWFGLGNEVSALRDAANVDGLVGWAVGPVHLLAKGGLILVWLAGSATLIALPIILRRRSRW